MRDLCQDNSLVDLRYGQKLDSINETESGMEAKITTTDDVESCTYQANYAVSCDRASSKSRKSLDIGLEGSPT